MLKPNQVRADGAQRRPRQPAVQRGRRVGVVRNPAEQRPALPRGHEVHRRDAGSSSAASASGTKRHRPPARTPSSRRRRMIVSSRSEPVETMRRRHAGHLFEPRDVAARGVGQIRPAADALASAPTSRASIRTPARRPQAGPRSDGNSVSVRAPQRVGRADVDVIEAVEHVELGQRERVEAVDADAVAHGDGVVPAAAARPAGDRAVLVAALAQAVAHLAGQLGRQRPLADARRVGLGDAQHAADRLRRHAEAGAHAADRRVRRRDVGIGAVVDVEQRALRAFEQNRLAVAHGLAEHQRDVAHPRLAAARRARAAGRARRARPSSCPGPAGCAR